MFLKRLLGIMENDQASVQPVVIKFDEKPAGQYLVGQGKVFIRPSGSEVDWRYVGDVDHVSLVASCDGGHYEHVVINALEWTVENLVDFTSGVQVTAHPFWKGGVRLDSTTPTIYEVLFEGINVADGGAKYSMHIGAVAFRLPNLTMLSSRHSSILVKGVISNGCAITIMKQN